ncbi:MAG: carboxypeptidase regulatory-like domain-containing protein [Acidobacteria bacterium]|nr:carboxypeptidase regulatory-like domain-containing protein [Acidobacteriota bacterium]
MHRVLRTLTLAAAASLLLPLAAFAQTSSLAGVVKGEDGKPLKDAIVKIERKDIKGNYKTKTNKKGEYIHAGLPLGTYKITLEVEGKDRDVVDGVRTTLGDPKEINFDLHAMKKKQESLAAAAQSGTLTKDQERDMTPEQRAAMEKAIKERSQAMAKNKALNDAFNQGVEALKTGQFEAAVTAFAKGAEMDAKQHVIWAQLAESYMGVAKTKTGDEQAQVLAKGFEAYNKAIELKPDDSGYHNNFGLALARAKKFPEAQAELTKAAQIEPTKAGVYYYNLGALLVNANQTEPAGEAFKKALEADPNHADSQYQYGIYLIGKMPPPGADGKVSPLPGTKEAFSKYLELKPDGPFAESAKGMLAMFDTQIATEFKNPAAQKKGVKKK